MGLLFAAAAILMPSGAHYLLSQSMVQIQTYLRLAAWAGASIQHKPQLRSLSLSIQVRICLHMKIILLCTGIATGTRSN